MVDVTNKYWHRRDSDRDADACIAKNSASQAARHSEPFLLHIVPVIAAK